MKHLLAILLCAIATLGSAQQRPIRSVSILGDSYSTFQGFLEPDTNFVWYRPVAPYNDVSRVEQMWWHLLLSEAKLTLAVNNSFSGSTICNTGYNREDYSRRSFIARMNHLGQPDLILILGDTNDDWAKAPIGDYLPQGVTPTAAQLYTFRPALSHLLRHMKARYVNVPIYFIHNSDLSETITQSVRRICEEEAIPCIFLRDIDKQQAHPSIRGMQAIKEQVLQRLKQDRIL